ncbi:RHS repeat-associated core domain-containing protein [Sulfurimonas sp.]|uniref:RHS repeat-associated core domain-containing protein n=1 Tax=Sulfurimonas sp. TaxID=2022749 RepID=UPI003D09687F
MEYDAIGRITKTQTPYITETFSFDPAHNLLNEGCEGDKVRGNRLSTYKDNSYEYDTFGNMTLKQIGNHTVMKFDYDAEHQMQTSTILKNGIKQTYHYTYDPFGRRVGKWNDFGVTHFVWDGNRLLSEMRNAKSTTYVYEPYGFIPSAQIDQNDNVQYYHSDQLGTPRELTNQEGNITWEAQYQTWGNTLKVEYKRSEDKIHDSVQQQPLRFQGQYYDHETGLHYNRFRYYDPDIGRFVSQDPIGLLGGNNLYQYAPNPISWIDPLGLAKVPTVTQDSLGRNERWDFRVEPSDLGTGTATTQKTRDYAKSFGCGDDAGHIRGNNLGGSGSDTKNIIGQNPSVNRGEYNRYEKKIADKVESDQTGADCSITATYGGNSGRPSSLKYDVTFDDGTKMSKVFNNPC